MSPSSIAHLYLAVETLDEALLKAERERDTARSLAGHLWRRLVQATYELGLARRQLRELRQTPREAA